MRAGNYDPFPGDAEHQAAATARAVERTRYVLERMVAEELTNLMPKPGDGKAVPAEVVNRIRAEAKKLLDEGFTLPFRKGHFGSTARRCSTASTAGCRPGVRPGPRRRRGRRPRQGRAHRRHHPRRSQHEATYGLWHHLTDLGVMLEGSEARRGEFGIEPGLALKRRPAVLAEQQGCELGIEVDLPVHPVTLAVAGNGASERRAVARHRLALNGEVEAIGCSLGGKAGSLERQAREHAQRLGRKREIEVDDIGKSRPERLAGRRRLAIARQQDQRQDRSEAQPPGRARGLERQALAGEAERAVAGEARAGGGTVDCLDFDALRRGVDLTLGREDATGRPLVENGQAEGAVESIEALGKDGNTTDRGGCVMEGDIAGIAQLAAERRKLGGGGDAGVGRAPAIEPQARRFITAGDRDEPNSPATARLSGLEPFRSASKLPVRQPHTGRRNI